MNPRVLLVWMTPPDYVPPLTLSERQVTLCPKGKVRRQIFDFFSVPKSLVECPDKDFDLYEFVQYSDQVEDKEFDLVIVWTSSVDLTSPFNTKKFGCPTVLLAGDTHHHVLPITHLLTYWATEAFDYIATAYDRQHLHWFAAAGVQRLAWLPFISACLTSSSWIEKKEIRVAFVGNLNFNSYHYRRLKLIMSLKKLGLPLLIKTRVDNPQLIFGGSLISFNCSQNGDLNLRNLEVISAGGFLLTDQLSFASGLDEL
ncbi:hypothetical protein ACVWYZ_002831, partial [Thermostichus sp. MS-CIW-37]